MARNNLRVSINHHIHSRHSGDNFLTHSNISHIITKCAHSLTSCPERGTFDVTHYNSFSFIYHQNAQLNVQFSFFSFERRETPLSALPLAKASPHITFYNENALNRPTLDSGYQSFSEGKVPP